MITIDTQADAFIQRWQGNDGSEKANFQLFISELCALLGVAQPDPACKDNKQNAYVFERRVDLFKVDGSSNTGFIDCYRRDCFVLEGKHTGKKSDSVGLDNAMIRARNQAEGYIRNLPEWEKKPPFMLLTDVGHVIELYAEFSCSGSTYVQFPDSKSYRLKLDDLRQPAVRERLAAVWTDPHSLDESKKAAKVTRQIATQLAELAKSLEATHSAEAVGTFLMRCLFTMFAEDVELLPKDRFTHLLEKLLDKPGSFQPAVGNLWSLMDKGGFDGGEMVNIKRFNGGLFAGATALVLTAPQIQMLLNAAKADWRYVEPAIFGTLLERALNPKERHKLGAHYTPRAYVERLVLPTVLEPLRQQWKDVQVEALLEELQAAKGKKTTKGRKNKEAIAKIRAFHQRLCHLRILDPACGSGNFLYVTLEHLKRLEGEVLGALADLGDAQGSLEMEGASVNPQQFLGLEVNPRAAAIAEMVLWIGYLQWHFRVHGNVAPAEPILRDFHNIENRDAVLAYAGVETVRDAAGHPVTRWDGRSFKTHPVTGKEVPDETAQIPVLRYLKPRKAAWPAADYIIGNPPFIGAAPMRATLGDGYVETLRKTWDEVPESSDFVMYWWHKAAEMVRAGKAQRFGFITTNSLRQTFNRRVVQAQLEAKDPLSLIFAIPDHPWVDSADGAAVRIAMTVGQAGDHPGTLQTVTAESTTDGEDATTVTLKTTTGKLHPDLTAGANIAATKPLQANADLSNRGFCLFGAGFVVSREQAKTLGLGREVGIEKHIREYRNGRDIAQSPRDVMVVDVYGLQALEVQTQYPAIYQHLLETVKPERDTNNRESRRKNWWIFGEPNPKLRQQLAGLNRYIATVETSKHRFFIFLDQSIAPDNKLLNIALNDAWCLGVVSSRVHVKWSLAQGSTLEDRPVYVKTTCFENFPFPEASDAQKAQIRELAEQIDAHRKRQQAENPTLTLTNMYNVLEKLRHQEPLNDKEKTIHQQGLTSVLQELHDKLDHAVFNAYGWDDLAAQLVGKPGATTPLPDKPEAQAQAEETLLSRLVDLNAQRAAEEASGTIRWLRPDFQAPEKQASTSLSQREERSLSVVEGNEVEGNEVEGNTPTAKRPWPKILSEQIQQVRECLTATPMTSKALAAQFKGKSTALQGVLDSLVMLGIVREEQGVYAMT